MASVFHDAVARFANRHDILAIVLHGNLAVILRQNQIMPVALAEIVEERPVAHNIVSVYDHSQDGVDGIRTREYVHLRNMIGV